MCFASLWVIYSGLAAVGIKTKRVQMKLGQHNHFHSLTFFKQILIEYSTEIMPFTSAVKTIT